MVVNKEVNIILIGINSFNIILNINLLITGRMLSSIIIALLVVSIYLLYLENKTERDKLGFIAIMIVVVFMQILETIIFGPIV